MINGSRDVSPTLAWIILWIIFECSCIVICFHSKKGHKNDTYSDKQSFDQMNQRQRQYNYT